MTKYDLYNLYEGSIWKVVKLAQLKKYMASGILA